MALTRRSFIAGSLAAAAALAAGACRGARALPRRTLRAMRAAFPGRIRPLRRDEVASQGKWLG